MKTFYRILIILIALMFMPEFMNTLLAAPPPPPPTVPIDGGLGFLLAAGVAYGARKLYQSNQK